ncbi:AKT5 [Symbiodinium sp. CCMP2592]|nr:AKT5 [Symbiodinium sp. CCMP2592]
MPLQERDVAAPLVMHNGDSEEVDLHQWMRHLLAEHRLSLEAKLLELKEGQRYITELLTVNLNGDSSARTGKLHKVVSWETCGDKDSDVAPPATATVEDTELTEGHNKDACNSVLDNSDGPLHEPSMAWRVKPKPKRASSLQGNDFALREVWAKHYSRSSNKVPLSGQTSETMGSHTIKLALSPSMENVNKAKNAKGLIAYPASKHRVAWDLFGGLLILYDLFMIPLKVFEYPDTLFTDAMDWMTLLFWTLNVAATLTVGFTRRGETVMAPREIFKNYLRTWCIVDVITLVPDWAFTLVRIATPNLEDASSGGLGEEGVRLLRILRLARTARLLRLLKLQKVMEKISDYLDSEVASIMANIAKMILLLLALNHLIACVWYALSIAFHDAGVPAWVDSGMLTEPWDIRYVTSFHWSITQFTPASKPQIHPANIVEQTFAIFVVVFALVGFSYVVGSILGSLAQLRSMTEQSAKDFWMMRRFLRRNHVPMELASRIQRFVEHAHSQQQKKMSIQEVKVLSLLSGGLMEELQCAMNMPHMMLHPLFAFLNNFSVITVQRLAKEAVQRFQLARGDTQFLPNQEGSYLYFIASGRMQYVRDADTPNERVEVVDKGEDWIGEPVIWTPFWIHVGQLTAVSECDLCAVAPKAFGDIVALVRPVAAIVARYSQKFMLWVKDLDTKGELTDVMQGEDVLDLIRSFLD